jgi:hypothetical protein
MPTCVKCGKSLESWTIDWNVGSWKGWKRWDNGWMKLAKSKLEVTRQLGVSFIIPLLHKNLNTFSLDSFQVKMGQNSSYVTHTLQVLWKDETKLQGTRFHPNAFFKEIGGPKSSKFSSIVQFSLMQF